ncbi:MAG TPA: filamentous hemagglutinin N-terminal domain-containing protein, partial [Stenomitos sp.]
MIHRLPSTGEASIVLIPGLSRQLQHHSEIGDSASFSQAKTDTDLEEENDAIGGSCWQRQGWRLGMVLAFGISGAIASLPDCASAQVTADTTLGTIVTTPNGSTFEITGGTLVDGSTLAGTKNLFHSFSSFSIPSEGIGDFLNDPSINNILARVTGGTRSNIQGLIQAGGNANLFLMNPNGIIFGPGAELNIGGSFVATTANAIQFPGGGKFSVNSTVDSGNPLLAINPSAFFFNQIGNQPTPAIEVNNTILSVGSQGNPQSLLLLGGNVTINDATLQGFDGSGSDIQIGGFTGTGSVELSFDNDNKLRLNLPETGLPTGIVGANISLTNGARVDVSTATDNAGNILLAGGTVDLSSGTQLDSSTFGAGDAGQVEIRATESVDLEGEGT